MSTETTTGVVSVDYDNDEANCTIHGPLGGWDAEAVADKHADRNENCWADHCGGKGCAVFECVCQHSDVSR